MWLRNPTLAMTKAVGVTKMNMKHTIIITLAVLLSLISSCNQDKEEGKLGERGRN